MDIFFNNFPLLRGKYTAIMTSDGSDSMLVTTSMLDLLSCFFGVRNYMGSNWWYWDLDSLDSYYRIEGNKFYFNNRILAESVDYVDIEEAMILDGYVYLLFSINRESGLILVVVERDSYYFLGCVSSHYGTISSPELSRLILATPEIDWTM